VVQSKLNRKVGRCAVRKHLRRSRIAGVPSGKQKSPSPQAKEIRLYDLGFPACKNLLEMVQRHIGIGRWDPTDAIIRFTNPEFRLRCWERQGGIAQFQIQTRYGGSAHAWAMAQKVTRTRAAIAGVAGGAHSP